MRVRAAAIATLLLTGVWLNGQQGPIESLVSRSPFLPPGYRVAPAVQPTTPTPPTAPAGNRYELVGVVAIDGEVSVSLRRRGEPRGTWLAPGESLDSIRFVRFQLSSREAIVENGGRREVIPLKAPTVTGEMPAPVAPNPTKPPRPPFQTVTQSPQESSETVKLPVRRRVIVPAE